MKFKLFPKLKYKNRKWEIHDCNWKNVKIIVSQHHWWHLLEKCRIYYFMTEIIFLIGEVGGPLSFYRPVSTFSVFSPRFLSWCPNISVTKIEVTANKTRSLFALQLIRSVWVQRQNPDWFCTKKCKTKTLKNHWHIELRYNCRLKNVESPLILSMAKSSSVTRLVWIWIYDRFFFRWHAMKCGIRCPNNFVLLGNRQDDTNKTIYAH